MILARKRGQFNGYFGFLGSFETQVGCSFILVLNGLVFEVSIGCQELMIDEALDHLSSFAII